jgi:hypothetical protein
MRLGILADIHEDIEALTLALDRLRRESVDRVVVLGDLFDTGERVEATVDLLADAGAVGVWGNHDLGLCHEPSERTRGRYPPRVFAFTQTLRPHLELQGCLFSHGLPDWDATEPAIYYLGARPETEEGRAGPSGRARVALPSWATSTAGWSRRLAASCRGTGAGRSCWGRGSVISW